MKKPCGGDCNGNGLVTINELVLGVRIALDAAAFAECPALDDNLDATLTINELVGAVLHGLDGCPAPGAS